MEMGVKAPTKEIGGKEKGKGSRRQQLAPGMKLASVGRWQRRECSRKMMLASVLSSMTRHWQLRRIRKIARRGRVDVIEWQKPLTVSRAEMPTNVVNGIRNGRPEDKPR